MKTKYNPQGYEGEFRGKASSAPFYAQKPIDRTNAIKQQSKEELDQLKFDRRALDRQASLDNTNLKANQALAKAELNATQSTNSALLKGLGALSSTAFKFADQQATLYGKVLEENELIDSYNEQIFGSTLPTQENNEAIQVAEDVETQLLAGANATAEVSGGNPVLYQAAGGANVEASRVTASAKSQGAASAFAYAPSLRQWSESGEIVMTSKGPMPINRITDPLDIAMAVDAKSAELAARFFPRTRDRRALAQYAEMVRNSKNTIVTNRSSIGAALAADNSWSSMSADAITQFQAVAGPGGNAQMSWDSAMFAATTSGKYPTRDKQVEAAIDLLIADALYRKDDVALRKLETSYKIRNADGSYNEGVTLGSDPITGAKIRSALKSIDQNIDYEGARASKELTDTLNADLAKPENQDAEKRRALVQEAAAAMDRIPGQSGKAQELRESIGSKDDPTNSSFALESVLDTIEDGGDVTAEQIRTNPNLGREDQATALAALEEKGKVIQDAEVELIKKNQVDAAVDRVMVSLGNKKNPDGSFTYSAEFDPGKAANIKSQIEIQLNRVAKDAMKNTPGDIKAKRAAANTAMQDWYNTNVRDANGAFNFEDSNFEGSIKEKQAAKQAKLDDIAGPSATYVPTLSPKQERARTPLSFNLSYDRTLSKVQLQAVQRWRGDTIFTGGAQNQLAETFALSGQFPESFKVMARMLGVNERVLFNEQQQAHQLDAVIPGLEYGDDISGPETDTYLMDQGIPPRTREYLQSIGPQFDTSTPKQVWDEFLQKSNQTYINLNGRQVLAGDVILNKYSTPRQLTAAFTSMYSQEQASVPLDTYRSQVSSITYDSGQPGIDIFFEDHKFPAVLPGTVKDMGYQVNGDGSGYGHYLVIESIDPATGQPVDVLYGHLPERPSQSIGQDISGGEVIGMQGGTGSVQSYDGTIASIDFLAPAPAGSGSMTPYSNYQQLRSTVANQLGG
jgi:hypothetical protein